MSRVVSTPYIEWAKQTKGTWNLASSGLPAPAWDDLGGVPRDMPWAGDNAYGYPPLLERIAARQGVRPAQVVTATGCSMATFLTLAALLEPGDEALIERPTYEPLVLAALHLGASVTRFDRTPATAFRVDPEAVIARLSSRTKVIVITDLHNPSSQGVARASLQRIGAAAELIGARVLVDEVYREAMFDRTPPCCVHLGPAFVSTSSLTKVYGLAALRCGWVVADEALARRIWCVNDLYENSRPFAPDWLAVVAFDRLQALGERSRALLETNRQLFAEWAERRTDLEFSLPEWGTTVCVRPTKVEAERLCDQLRTSYDVSVVPGRFFELPDHVRLALCAETPVLREGLARLGRCLDAQAAANRFHLRDHGALAARAEDAENDPK